MATHEPGNGPAADPAAWPNPVRGERSKNPSSQVPGSKAGNPARRKETI
jgi:hypothetical protein